MSTAIANPVQAGPVGEYVRKLCDSDPATALEIALAELERERALAARASEEYRALAEIAFDRKGRIVKANMAGLWRMAQSYASSQSVPEQYQGKPHDCFIALQMAFRLGCDAMAYMQASYVVSGKPGIEAKLATALLNTSGLIVGRIKYKLEGTPDKDDRRCTASAIDAETGQEVSVTIDWAMVKAEGWLTKKLSKWQTMPDIMFRYRAATFLIRTYYSEVTMGMQTVDELHDIGPDKGTVDVETVSSLDELAEKLEKPTESGAADETEEKPAEEKPAEPMTQEESEAASGELFDKAQSAVEAGA